MKPLPTLTKPLRSVDIATSEPAQALRERTDSCTVPAAGVVGEAMLAIVLAGAYREKFGGDHIDDVARARWPPTRSASGGSGGSRTARSSSSASWAPARRPPPAPPPPRSACARSTPTTCSSSASARSIEDYFASHGERAFREAEEDVVAELLERPPAPVISLGGGAIALRARARAARPPHRRAARRRRARPPGSAPAASAGRWRATASASPRCTPSARRSTRRWPTRCCPTAARDDGAPRRAGAARARDAPPGAKLLWAAQASGDYPVYVGDGLARLGFWPRARARASWSPTRPSARCYGGRDRGRRGALRDAGRRGGQDARARRALLRGLAGAGHGPRRPRGGARRRRRRRPRGLLRRGLPARRAASCRCRRRSSRRSTPPTAARPGSTCPRARTTSAPTTSRARCSPIRALLATLPRGRARRGLGRGDQDGADRRRAAVGARRAAAIARSTATSCSPARAPSSASWRATSATRAAARSSTSATRSGTRSRPRPATARYRHGEAVGLGLLAALTLSGQPELRVEVARSAGRARAADDARPRRRPRRGARRRPARQEAPRRARRLRAGRGAGRRAHRARRSPSATSAPRWQSGCRDEEPRRRPARRQPRRARPAPGRSTTAA